MQSEPPGSYRIEQGQIHGYTSRPGKRSHNHTDEHSNETEGQNDGKKPVEQETGPVKVRVCCGE